MLVGQKICTYLLSQFVNFGLDWVSLSSNRTRLSRILIFGSLLKSAAKFAAYAVIDLENSRESGSCRMSRFSTSPKIKASHRCSRRNVFHESKTRAQSARGKVVYAQTTRPSEKVKWRKSLRNLPLCVVA